MKFANQIKMNIHLHNPYWEGRISSRGPLIVHSLGCYSNYLRQDRSHELLVFSGITSLWLLVSHMFAKINKVCVTTTKPRPGWLVVSIQHQLLAVILCHTFTGFNHTSQGTIHDHLISDGSQISSGMVVASITANVHINIHLFQATWSISRATFSGKKQGNMNMFHQSGRAICCSMSKCIDDFLHVLL